MITCRHKCSDFNCITRKYYTCFLLSRMLHCVTVQTCRIRHFLLLFSPFARLCFCPHLQLPLLCLIKVKIMLYQSFEKNSIQTRLCKLHIFSIISRRSIFCPVRFLRLTKFAHLFRYTIHIIRQIYK